MADEETLLSLEQITSTDDVEYATISVPEWKGSIRLASLDGESAVKWSEEEGGIEGKGAGLRLLVLSLVDKDGNRIGTTEIVAMLKKKNARVVSRLVQEALKLNGMLPKQAEERKNESGEAISVASPTV